jgi:hypothetical protein
VDVSLGPLWSGPAEQPLWLPPGELVGLRVQIDRSSLIPQLGAAIEGTLTVWPGTGSPDRIPIRRLALGDNDTSIRWTELQLERSVRLEGRTYAYLSLSGEPPIWPPSLVTFSFPCGTGGATAHLNGEDFDCALRVAAVYRVEDGTALSLRP